MSKRRTRKSMTVRAAELSIAVPAVIAHRVTRMAQVGTSHSVRDRKEFYRMSTEKIAAFNESWNAMAFQAVRANQQMVMSFMQSFWFPWGSAKSSTKSTSLRKLTNAAQSILEKGLVPIHRRVISNSKRLRRVK